MVITESSIETGETIHSDSNTCTEIENTEKMIMQAFTENNITVETAFALFDKAKEEIKRGCSQVRAENLI